MSVIPAGTEVQFTITYLEMTTRPDFPHVSLPPDVRLEQAIAPPVWFFLSLYGAVGRDYEWHERFVQEERDPEALQAFVGDPRVSHWVAYRAGWPVGFFVLDHRMESACDLAYFGLVPEAVGSGIGGPLLKIALTKGWEGEGVTRMTVNTCTLDHPRALGLYGRMGFAPTRTETRRHVLYRDRDTALHPA